MAGSDHERSTAATAAHTAHTARAAGTVHAAAGADAAWIAIGDFARRAGVAASALRFYEAEGLLAGRRSGGGRRLYRRADLRRVAFVRVAQSVGLSLADIRTALATLPEQRTPTRADWQRLSRQWQPLIDERIATLVRLRERLASCIGCGCLSLKTCALVNPGDEVAVRGPGPRYLLGDRPPDGARDTAPKAHPEGRPRAQPWVPEPVPSPLRPTSGPPVRARRPAGAKPPR